jgi:hypothetical protein
VGARLPSARCDLYRFTTSVQALAPELPPPGRRPRPVLTPAAPSPAPHISRLTDEARRQALLSILRTILPRGRARRATGANRSVPSFSLPVQVVPAPFRWMLLIRNQQVRGSNPRVGSSRSDHELETPSQPSRSRRLEHVSPEALDGDRPAVRQPPLPARGPGSRGRRPPTKLPMSWPAFRCPCRSAPGRCRSPP